MKWIGLTGGLGSGKTTVADYLRKKGIPVADADHLAKSALEQSPELLSEIQKRYGPQILGKDGIDRKALGEIVFKSKVELEWLESQIHPLVRKGANLLREDWSKMGYKMAFYDVPLLYEKSMEDLFDKVVVVSASSDDILKRVSVRDRLDLRSIEDRLQNQIPLDKKVKRADHVLSNDSDLPHLYRQIDELLIALG